jgi:hypothetical protein
MPSDDPRSLPWCDVQLVGLAIPEGGRDLVLEFRGPEAEVETKGIRHLRCTWTDGLRVDLTHAPGTGGHPLSWDATFEPGDDGRWTVRLDFGSTGEIRFRCNEVVVSYGALPE